MMFRQVTYNTSKIIEALINGSHIQGKYSVLEKNRIQNSIQHHRQCCFQVSQEIP